MPRSRLVLSAALLALAACSRGDSDMKVSFDPAKADSSAGAPLGPGDVRVTSLDGALILALVGDSVRMQLSDSLRDKVKQELDTSSQDGFGGLVARSVSGIVGSAMGFVARVPVSEIESIRYEDGNIRMETRNGKFRMTGKDGDGKSSAAFSPADGERFVAAVQARQRELASR